MEDGYDSLYNQEPSNYNITYYYEGNSGITYPIGRLLLLSGSINNKLTKIYLNNPLDYDVVLDVLHADILQPSVIPPSGDIIATNLYYSDIITDKVYCSGVTTTTLAPTTTLLPTTVMPTTTMLPTTTLLDKDLMRITLTTGYTGLTYDGEYYTGITYIYTATGDTIGLFDYYYNNQWFYAGESSNFLFFTNISGITLIRFYFDLNDNYYGTLKTNLIEPLNHNNGLYFVDVDIYGTNDNLILNGNFSYHLDYWSSFILTGSTPNIIGGVCTMQVGLAEDDWYYQLQQVFTGLLKNDVSYKLKFKMWASNNCSAYVAIEDAANGYNRIGFSVDPHTVDEIGGSHVIVPSGASYFYYDLTTIPTYYEFDILNFNDILPNTIPMLNFLLSTSNNILYVDNVSLVRTILPIISGSTISGSTSGSTSGVTSGSTSGDSTEFIITSLTSFLTGYTINQYFIPYDNIISIELSGNSIYLYTITIKYILKFLTVYDLNMAYYRMTFVYNSHLNHNCVYLTVDNIFENGIIV
jgi:hypothetical protein